MLAEYFILHKLMNPFFQLKSSKTKKFIRYCVLIFLPTMILQRASTIDLIHVYAEMCISQLGKDVDLSEGDLTE